MTLRFGTDGIRGVANSELTVELATAIGRAAARALGLRHVIIGRDTRRSGPLLEAALAAGLAAEGVRVLRAGVLPTPGVAWWCARTGHAGAVISASHNPFADNGIKLLLPGGRKLSDEHEAKIEAVLDELRSAGLDSVRSSVTGADVGAIEDLDAAAAEYADALTAMFEPGALSGMRVMADVGHGAAVATAARALTGAGAEVTMLNAEPDGTNINDGCGSTDPAGLAAAVVTAGADAGLAFDGDADRVIAVAHDGTVVDGDRMLILLAQDMAERDLLRDRRVVVTVMSNLGLHRALGEVGIEVITTGVGDRYVLDALDEHGLSLGGEQSGHVILRDLASTGDGLLCGMALLALVRRSGRPLADLAAEAMTSYPQHLVSVSVAGSATEVAAAVAGEAAAVEAELGDDGRVLVRPSGTEPVVRVMVEALDADIAADALERLVSAVETAASARSSITTGAPSAARP